MTTATLIGGPCDGKTYTWYGTPLFVIVPIMAQTSAKPYDADEPIPIDDTGLVVALADDHLRALRHARYERQDDGRYVYIEKPMTWGHWLFVSFPWTYRGQRVQPTRILAHFGHGWRWWIADKCAKTGEPLAEMEALSFSTPEQVEAAIDSRLGKESTDGEVPAEE